MAGTVTSKVQHKLLIKMIMTLVIQILFTAGDCSTQFLTNSDDFQFDTVNSRTGNTSESCEKIYQEYLNVIDNFTHCELMYARPFRLCVSCSKQFEMAKAIYMNLTQEPRHVECKIKYMQSDRVQVIPTVQTNLEAIWNKAHCQNCYSYNPDGLETGTVAYREDVAKFLELYANFSTCINSTEQEDIIELRTNDGNTSSKCRLCNHSYSLLNAHYNAMYNTDAGDVCMDVMDRMNYTRMFWSLHLKCTHRDGDHDALPVVVISCVVACTPIMFYVSLRLTGKVGRKRIFKQKRLRKGHDTAADQSHGAGGDTAASKRRHTTAD